MTRSSVEQLGGTLSLSSLPGQGTTATAVLPADVIAEAHRRCMMRPLLLIVEDDEVAARAAGEGVRASVASRCDRRRPARTPGRIAAEEPPECVILDLRVGDENGLDLIPALQRSRSGDANRRAHRIRQRRDGGRSGAAGRDALSDEAGRRRRNPGGVRARRRARRRPTPPLQPMSLDRVEWEHINRVLVDCGGNVSEAARMLGLHRRSLQRKLAKYPSRR